MLLGRYRETINMRNPGTAWTVSVQGAFGEKAPFETTAARSPQGERGRQGVFFDESAREDGRSGAARVCMFIVSHYRAVGLLAFVIGLLHTLFVPSCGCYRGAVGC